MIFAALLESGTVRFMRSMSALRTYCTRSTGRDWSESTLDRGGPLTHHLRVPGAELWLRRLIANGYRVLACVLIAIFVLPLLTVGIYRLTQRSLVSPEFA